MVQKDKKREALLTINSQFQIMDRSPKISSNEDQFKALSRCLNDLIDHDFNRLINLLYRIDVSEQKVRAALANNQTQQSAGTILANLLIEREIQKIELRDKYSSK